MRIPIGRIRATVRSRRRGFILAAAIAICFAMVVISLIVANQNRAMVGFSRNTHAEAQQSEAAWWGFSRMKGYLQGQGSMTQIFGSLPTTPTANNLTVTTNSTDASVKMDWKITTRPPGNITEAHSYEGGQNANGASSIKVPPGHTSALMTNTVLADTSAGNNRFFAMFTSNHPFAVISENGQVRVNTVRSVSNHTASNFTAQMADVFARGPVQIGGRLNGRAFSRSATVTVANQGIPYPSYPNDFLIPSDFNQKLGSFQNTQALTGLDSNVQNALGAMNAALHRSFVTEERAQTLAHMVPRPPQISYVSGVLNSNGDQPVTDVQTVPKSSMGNSDYDSPTGTLTLGASLRIPGGKKERLTFARIDAAATDLWLEDDTVLRLDGDATFRHVYLGRRATLSLAGSLTAQRLSLTYSAGQEPITSAVLTGGAVNLNGGSNRQIVVQFNHIIPERRTQSIYPATQTPIFLNPPPTPNAPPVPLPDQRDSTILNTAFMARANADYAAVIAAGLPEYLGAVTTDVSNDVDVPGALISAGGDIRCTLGKLSGLLVARGAIQGPTVIGAAWAGGDVTVGNVCYFPYFTRAFGHTPAGNVTLDSTQANPTAFGKLP